MDAEATIEEMYDLIRFIHGAALYELVNKGDLRTRADVLVWTRELAEKANALGNWLERGSVPRARRRSR